MLTLGAIPYPELWTLPGQMTEEGCAWLIQDSQLPQCPVKFVGMVPGREYHYGTTVLIHVVIALIGPSSIDVIEARHDKIHSRSKNN